MDKLNQTEPSNSPHSLSSFTLNDHINLSWERLKSKVLRLFTLSVISFISTVVLITILGAVGFAMTVAQPEVVSIFSKIEKAGPSALTSLPMSYIVSMSILFVIFVLVMIVISSISSIGSLLSLHSSYKEEKLMKIIIDSIKLIPLIILYGLVSGLLVLGGFGLFIIAGIVIQVFISFAYYVTVFDKKKPFAAIHRSVQLISSEFGLVLGRILLLFLVSIVVTLLLQTLNKGDLKPFVSILTAIFNVFMGWFSLAYFIELYEYLDKKVSIEKQVHVIWIYIVSLIGWVFLLLMTYLFVTFLGPKIMEEFKDNGKKKESSTSSITNIVPSNCGLNIPLPDTYDSSGKEDRAWIYEERELAKDNFRSLIPDSTVTNVLGAFVSFKTGDQRFKATDTTYKTNYPGLNIMCISNPGGYDLDGFVEQAKKNGKYTVTLDERKTYGEVELQSIWIEGVDATGDYFKEPLHLGVSKDTTRLFFIKIWAASDKDSIAKQLSEDIDTILNNLKYRTVSEELSTETSVQTNTQQVPNCTKYKIYEGEFTSDKCYKTQDYQDLQYYLSQYNASVSTYNGAISSMRITCSGSDFFKDSCERDTAKKNDSEKKINEYKGIVQGIISRGV